MSFLKCSEFPGEFSGVEGVYHLFAYSVRIVREEMKNSLSLGFS